MPIASSGAVRSACVACLALLTGLAACSSPVEPLPDLTSGDALLADGSVPTDLEPSPYPLDDVLRFNHIQVRGTHNSYHVQPEQLADPSHAFTQQPLQVQLAEQGVRQFELDIHYRTGGGFEVFHLPMIDPMTTCQRLVDCLGAVKTWSDANRGHVPITFWIEPKDDVDTLDPELEPLEGKFGELEETILSVWPRDRIFTPDDLRGEHADLPTAVETDGWPTLGSLRGKVIFSLLDSNRYRDEYTLGALNLAGRLMFVDADSPDDPFAAMFKIDDAPGEAVRVTELVQAGYIVTSNVDGTGETAEDNQTRLDGSLAAGIHHGSSDFPALVDGYDYFMDLPGGTPARCNPVFAAAKCAASDIEQLP